MATTTQTQPVTATANTDNTERKRAPSDLVLAFFTSPLFMMAALGLALLAQGKHTADVFAFWSHKGTPEWLFYAFAGGVEIAVFIFVLHDHKRTSYAFAVGAFATNVVYYAIGGANLLSAEALPVLLLSVLLPGVIVGYSHTIAERPQTATPPAKPAKPAKPRRYRWQFWRLRPAAAAIAATNTARPARQTGLESTGGIETPSTITVSEIEPPSAPPVGTAQALDDGGKPAEPTKATKRPSNPNRDRALQMRSEGFTASEIAGLLGEKESTVASWLYRGAQKNGVAK